MSLEINHLNNNSNQNNNSNKIIIEGEEEVEGEDKCSIKIEKREMIVMMKDFKVELKIIYEIINLIRMYSAESDIK